MPTLIDKLAKLGFDSQQTLQERKVIVVKENGKEYRLTLEPQRLCAAYQVDGYIIKEGNRCDKLVLAVVDKDRWVETFVELKGRDTEHAIKQLETTIQNMVFAIQPLWKNGHVLWGRQFQDVMGTLWWKEQKRDLKPYTNVT